MELTRFVPARRRLTAAVAVGAMALTMAGLHAPGAGAASQQPPPVCQTFTVADAQGVATGQVTGQVEAGQLPGGQTGQQAGTQDGGVPQAATNQAGQAGQPGTTASSANGTENISCVVDVAGDLGQACIVTNPNLVGQAGGAGTFSTGASATGPAGQQDGITGGVPSGGGQHSLPDQGPVGVQTQAGGAAPAGSQVQEATGQATASAGTAGTQSGAGALPAETETASGGVTAAQSNQPFVGTGGNDAVLSAANTGGTVGACGNGLSIAEAGTVAPGQAIENGAATSSVEPAFEQVPAGGCEETVLSESKLPGGGTIKVSITPC